MYINCSLEAEPPREVSPERPRSCLDFAEYNTAGAVAARRCFGLQVDSTWHDNGLFQVFFWTALQWKSRDLFFPFNNFILLFWFGFHKCIFLARGFTRPSPFEPEIVLYDNGLIQVFDLDCSSMHITWLVRFSVFSTNGFSYQGVPLDHPIWAGNSSSW